MYPGGLAQLRRRYLFGIHTLGTFYISGTRLHLSIRAGKALKIQQQGGWKATRLVSTRSKVELSRVVLVSFVALRVSVVQFCSRIDRFFFYFSFAFVVVMSFLLTCKVFLATEK